MLHLHEAKLPGSEHLVAHAPEFHAIGRVVAVLRAPVSADALCRRVAILDPLRRGIGVTKAGVYRNHRLGVNLAAEGNELVRAEIVVLDAGPRGVFARWATVAVADAIAPVVTTDEVPARPAI